MTVLEGDLSRWRLSCLKWTSSIFVPDYTADFLFLSGLYDGEVVLHARLILANSDRFWRNLLIFLCCKDTRPPVFSALQWFDRLFNLLFSFVWLFLNSLDGLKGRRCRLLHGSSHIFKFWLFTQNRSTQGQEPQQHTAYWTIFMLQ